MLGSFRWVGQIYIFGFFFSLTNRKRHRRRTVYGQDTYTILTQGPSAASTMALQVVLSQRRGKAFCLDQRLYADDCSHHERLQSKLIQAHPSGFCSPN